MNRRKFFTNLAEVVGGVSLLEAIPFNRVWSFPKKIVVPKPKIRIESGSTFYYAFYNPKTGDLSDVIQVKGQEAEFMRQVITSGHTFDEVRPVALIEPTALMNVDT